MGIRGRPDGFFSIYVTSDRMLTKVGSQEIAVKANRMQKRSVNFLLTTIAI